MLQTGVCGNDFATLDEIIVSQHEVKYLQGLFR